MARDGSQRLSPGEGEARRPGQLGGRILRAWRRCSHEQRLAAGAAAGLFLTLFLPWYQETIVTVGARVPVTASLTGWAAFSWVEAAVLLIAAGVLSLLFQRAEGRAFHLPGGDGLVIMVAGLWTGLLVVWRVFDKQSTTVKGPGITTSGIEWGIFVALGVAALMAYAGSRLRAAHPLEPPLPGEEDLGEVTARRGVALSEPSPAAAPAWAPHRERPPGWLSARPRHLEEDPTVVRGEQLTIPLEERD